MKIQKVLVLIVSTSAFCAEEPGWKFDVSYGVGVADYVEEAKISPVKSDWSALGADLMLEAQKKQGRVYPFVRVRLTGTDQDEETWKEEGVLVQTNDMTMTGVDVHAGVEIPQSLQKGTVFYTLGFTAGFQNFERENFVRMLDETLIVAPDLTITEVVQTYGAGGGLAYEFPLNESWELGVESSFFWFFYTYADNDGFDTGIEGDGGGAWESAFWLSKRLKNPGQTMGLKFYADVQWTEGGDTLSDSGESVVEWPDSDWQYLSLALFWRGEF